MIREVALEDAQRIADIYNYYVQNTIITFENTVVSSLEIEQRIRKIKQKGYPFIVYLEQGCVIAYAYVDNWRTRSAYDITLETSIYVDKEYQRKGVGKSLYNKLINLSQKLNIHSLIGVISLPNDPSRNLHENLGFSLVGNFKESGKKFNQFIDVEFWQLILKEYE